MGKLDLLTKKIIKFRDERDWKQFHNPKDSAISLSLETSEVLEHFQWKSEEEIKEYIKNNKEKIEEELSDVLFWVLLMSYDLKIDIYNASIKKLEENKSKYPINKSKGRHTKYTNL
jgi:NTP pyrophosphatase (non-canonical NTP hydrolase)